MMQEYLDFKKKIQQQAKAVDRMVQELLRIGLVSPAVASPWQDQLALVQASLQDPLLRMAVVGSVKSGKSTLINAVVGNDLLKRGAGIITAFITRILTDSEVGGWVELKPWSEVNEELNGALHLLPILQDELSENELLDVRRSEDRLRLQQWLDRMQREWQQTRGQLDPNFIVLNAYLRGYRRLSDKVEESVTRLTFDEQSLEQHQQYVGREKQAVYVKDMELHYPIGWLGEKLEIADCQGSDSPNPLHYDLLQQYLLKSHFILYVISSRTGLREADFKLLDFIKTLRMFPQTFFILNTDLDVHPDLEDLDDSVERVRTELEWIIPNPRVYTFSSLYHLLQELQEGAAELDRRRLEFWRENKALAEHSEKGFEAFREQMVQELSRQRTRVLLGSGLSRMSMVAGSILDTTRAQKSFMDQDLGSLKKSAKQLKNRQKMLRTTLGTLENAIAGLKESLRKDLDNAVGSYFDLSHSAVIQETLDMVEHYPLEIQYQKQITDTRQLVAQLYRFYMEFRQALARHLIEKVNLRVFEFAKEQEAFLRERLQYSARAFWSLFSTALQDYRRELAPFHIELHAGAEEPREIDWSPLEQITPPSFSAFVDGQAVGRSLLLVKFGMGRLNRFFGSLKTRVLKAINRPTEESQEDPSLLETVGLVKSETRGELIYAFRDYRQNFKFQYLYKILDTGAEQLLEEFKTRTEMTQLDFANLLKQSEVEGERRQEFLEALSRIGQDAAALLEELEALRGAVGTVPADVAPAAVAAPLPAEPPKQAEQELTEPQNPLAEPEELPPEQEESPPDEEQQAGSSDPQEAPAQDNRLR